MSWFKRKKNNYNTILEEDELEDEEDEWEKEEKIRREKQQKWDELRKEGNEKLLENEIWKEYNNELKNNEQNIIRIEKKSDINKSWNIEGNKKNKPLGGLYKLFLKDKKYELFYGNPYSIIKINDFCLIESKKQDYLEINKYGNWNKALNRIIREIWLRDIENKTEEEILQDKNKHFEKVKNERLKYEYVEEYVFQKTKPIIEKCTTFHVKSRNPIGAYVFCDNKHNRKAICKLCFENHYQPTQQLAYQEGKQKWKEKNSK